MERLGVFYSSEWNKSHYNIFSTIITIFGVFIELFLFFPKIWDEIFSLFRVFFFFFAVFMFAPFNKSFCLSKFLDKVFSLFQSFWTQNVSVLFSEIMRQNIFIISDFFKSISSCLLFFFVFFYKKVSFLFPKDLRLCIFIFPDIFTIIFLFAIGNRTFRCFSKFLDEVFSLWKVSKVGDVSQGWPEGSFSIGTTPRCREGRYSILWIAPFTLDPYLIMLNVGKGSIKYHFLSVWYDSIWDWTLTSRTIDEHSTHLANKVRIKGSVEKSWERSSPLPYTSV